MKFDRRSLLRVVSISLMGVFTGCGGGGPEAIPTGNTPNYETGDIVKVEGLEPKEKKKYLKASSGPRQRPQ